MSPYARPIPRPNPPSHHETKQRADLLWLALAGLAACTAQWLAPGSVALAGTSAIPIPCVIVTPADDLHGVVVCPDSPQPIPSSILTVTALDEDCKDPMVGAAVTVHFAPGIEVCPGAVLAGTTDENGEVTFVLAAGGCLDEVPNAVVIRLDGVTVRIFRNVKSPDYDGEGASLRVDIADFVTFARQFNQQEPAICGDYANDGDCDVADLALFGPAFIRASHCP